VECNNLSSYLHVVTAVFVRPYTYGLHFVNKQERQCRNKKIWVAFAFLLLPCIAINMLYYKLVPLALVIQHAKRMCHKAHVPQSACATIYYLLWPARLYSIFPNISRKHKFRKKFIEYELYVLIFHINYVWNISYSKKNPARYYHKYKEVFIQSTGYSYQIVTELGFSRQFFFFNSETSYLYKNPSNGSRGVLCAPTDGRTELGW